jgi:hypothetical protein
VFGDSVLLVSGSTLILFERAPLCHAQWSSDPAPGCSQLINVLTLGSPNGTGVFFPNGFAGAINKPTGYNATANGTTDFPSSSNGYYVDTQVSYVHIPAPMLRSCSKGSSSADLRCALLPHCMSLWRGTISRCVSDTCQVSLEILVSGWP